MKYFGQYLVEKNLISIEILLDALLEQICSLPPICQVVRTKNLLPVNQVLKALELQSKKEIEFSQACRELGIWTQDLSTSIKNEVQKAKIPLGQILVEKGALSLSDLTHALDEFLSKDDNLLPSHPLAKSSADPSQKTSPYEFKNIRENMLGEVQSFFCHKTLNEIKLLYSSLPNSEHVIQTATALLKEVHTLKGFTVYLNLTIIVKLIHHMERQLTFLLRSPSLNSSN